MERDLDAQNFVSKCNFSHFYRYISLLTSSQWSFGQSFIHSSRGYYHERNSVRREKWRRKSIDNEEFKLKRCNGIRVAQLFVFMRFCKITFAECIMWCCIHVNLCVCWSIYLSICLIIAIKGTTVEFSRNDLRHRMIFPCQLELIHQRRKQL